MAEELAKTLLTKISEEGHHSSAKVTVVGTGQVGMAAAFAMMTQVRFKFSRVRAICSKSTVFFLITMIWVHINAKQNGGAIAGY